MVKKGNFYFDEESLKQAKDAHGDFSDLFKLIDQEFHSKEFKKLSDEGVLLMGNGGNSGTQSSEVNNGYVRAMAFYEIEVKGKEISKDEKISNIRKILYSMDKKYNLNSGRV